LSPPERIKNALAGGATESAVLKVAEIAAGVMAEGQAIGWRTTEQVPACGKGCSYCCHGTRVTVTIPEVARLVAYARRHLGAEQLARVEERAKDNAAKTHGKTLLGYPLDLRCALLDDDGSCSAYAARPLMCQKEHSLDVSQCKAAFENDDPSIDPPIGRAQAVVDFGEMALGAYVGAATEACLDVRSYELQEALHLALSTPDAVRAWLAGGAVFASAAQNDSDLVPLRKSARDWTGR
jgi:Fe-S-cluster containining protein